MRRMLQITKVVLIAAAALLWVTPSALAQTGVGYATFTGNPGGGITFTIGATQYVYHSANSCTGAVNCVVTGGSTAASAANLTAAINNNPAQCSTTQNAGIVAGTGGATESGTTVTITTTGSHWLGVGENVIVTGVGVGGYNGTWTVASVPSATTFTYTAASSGLANSGGGSANSCFFTSFGSSYTANPSVTAAVNASVMTVTNITSASVTWSTSGAITLYPLTTIPVVSVTQDSAAATAAGNGGVSSLSWSHTVHTGNSVYLVVALAYRVENASGGAGAGTYIPTLGGVTANGTNMQCVLAISDNNSGSCGSGNTAGSGGEPFVRSEIWYLSLGSIASTTTENIVATINVANSANGTNIAGTSLSYFGVSGVTSGGNAVSNGTSTTSASLAVTAASGLVVSNVALARSAGTVSATNSNTLLSSLIDPNGDSGFAHIEDATGSLEAPNPTMGFSWAAGSPYALVTVVLAPAATPTNKRKGQTIVGALLPPGGSGE
jgi:hypothetical protein